MRQLLRATGRAHNVVALAGDARMLVMSQETLMRSAGAELHAIVDGSGKAACSLLASIGRLARYTGEESNTIKGLR